MTVCVVPVRIDLCCVIPWSKEVERDVEATRAKAAGLGLSFPIVVQKQWEISLLYGMFATPVGYLIDERGILASDVAVGVGPILALMDNLNITKVFDDGTTASSPPLRKGGPGG